MFLNFCYTSRVVILNADKEHILFMVFVDGEEELYCCRTRNAVEYYMRKFNIYNHNTVRYILTIDTITNIVRKVTFATVHLLWMKNKPLITATVIA